MPPKVVNKKIHYFLKTVSEPTEFVPQKITKVWVKSPFKKLCFEDSKCKFWTYNPRYNEIFFTSYSLLPVQSVQMLLKTSDQGKSPSTKGSVSGQKACGAPGDFHFTWEHTYINTFRKAIKKKDFSQMADHPPPIPLFETPREKKLRDFEKKKSYFFTCDLWVIQVLFYK